MINLLFDTETTGIPLHPHAKPEFQPRIIEWGGVLVDEHGEIVDELGLLIDPEHIPTEKVAKLLTKEGIMKISGIDTDELTNHPTFTVAAEKIRPFFERADVLIAHNLPFDVTMMELDLKRCGITDWPWPEINVCTVQEHLPSWGRRAKLLELYEHYTGEPLAQTHRALDDAKALLTVCRESGVLR